MGGDGQGQPHLQAEVARGGSGSGTSGHTGPVLIATKGPLHLDQVGLWGDGRFWAEVPWRDTHLVHLTTMFSVSRP